MESIAVAVPPPAVPSSTPARSGAAASRPARTLQRVPPRVVNVATRMAMPIRGFEVRGQGLADFVALVSDASTIPITLDADALLAFGQSPSARVSVKLTDTTVSDLLDAALEPLHLGYQVRDGQLIVGYPPQEKSRQVRYAVSDLAADDAALGELAALVRRMIAPESWQQSGGKGSIVAGNGTLVIDQTEPALAQILVFCEKLRVACAACRSRAGSIPARFVSEHARRQSPRDVEPADDREFCDAAAAIGRDQMASRFDRGDDSGRITPRWPNRRRATIANVRVAVVNQAARGAVGRFDRLGRIDLAGDRREDD